jgi:ketosteroid isomerase-like protein
MTIIPLKDCIHKKSSTDDLFLLISAQQSFSKLLEAKGIRDAFLTYLADDAIVFRPKPVKARPLYFQSPAIPGLLTWKPVFADASSAGDLGYTTGPYEYRKDTASKQADGYGHYISVWKKQQDGNWRVVIDCGIVHPKPETPFIPGEISKNEHRSSIKFLSKYEINSEQRALLETDIAFFKASASEGIAKAFLDYANDQARYYRMNTFPIIGKENIMSSMNSQSGHISGTPITAEIAVSGDLGYTYGLSELKTDAETKANSYLRIWKKKPNGEWKVVLDLENPIPSKE